MKVDVYVILECTEGGLWDFYNYNDIGNPVVYYTRSTAESDKDSFEEENRVVINLSGGAVAELWVDVFPAVLYGNYIVVHIGWDLVLVFSKTHSFKGKKVLT